MKLKRTKNPGSVQHNDPFIVYNKNTMTAVESTWSPDRIIGILSEHSEKNELDVQYDYILKDFVVWED